ncbi:MAG TPA: hypothetical protein VN899_03775, partial [Stellaceae bacterium]|nr:hypothetical protein [Stellaceae bacterium]
MDNGAEHEAEAASREPPRRTQIGNLAVVLILLAAAVAATWAWRQAGHQSLEADSQRAGAETQRDRAQQRLAMAATTINGLVLDLANKFHNAGGVPAAAIKGILDQAFQLQDQLIGSGESSPDLRQGQADALIAATDTLLALGETQSALAAATHALEIDRDLLAQQPDSTDLQHDVALAYNKVGDVQLAQGHQSDALQSYQGGLAVAETLAKYDPGNAGWQRDLSVSCNKIGNVLAAQGSLLEALTFYQAALAIRDRLAKSDPSNTGWQRDLST